MKKILAFVALCMFLCLVLQSCHDYDVAKFYFLGKVTKKQDCLTFVHFDKVCWEADKGSEMRPVNITKSFCDPYEKFPINEEIVVVQHYLRNGSEEKAFIKTVEYLKKRGLSSGEVFLRRTEK